MTLNTTNLGAQSPLPEGGKSLRTLQAGARTRRFSQTPDGAIFLKLETILKRSTMGIAVAFAATWIGAQASAAPCQATGSCEAEVSASIVAPLDVFLAKCTSTYPEEAQAYREYSAQSFSKADPYQLEALRASDAYANVAKQASLRINKLQPAELHKACNRVFSKKS